MRKALEWLAVPFVLIALIGLLLLMGILVGGSALIRLIQYRTFRLALMGLQDEQKKALLHLLQYKELFGYRIAARELDEAEWWRAQIDAQERRVPLVVQCRSLRIPEWRIRIAT